MKVARTEARLAALREVGIDVCRWIEKAQEKARGDRPNSETPGEWAVNQHSQSTLVLKVNHESCQIVVG